MWYDRQFFKIRIDTFGYLIRTHAHTYILICRTGSAISKIICLHLGVGGEAVRCEECSKAGSFAQAKCPFAIICFSLSLLRTLKKSNCRLSVHVISNIAWHWENSAMKMLAHCAFKWFHPFGWNYSITKLFSQRNWCPFFTYSSSFRRKKN